MAEFQPLHAVGKPASKCVVNAGLDVKSVGRGACLPHVAHLGDYRPLDRRLNVGIVKDDERSISAEFHHRSDDVVGSCVKKLAPHLGRACKGYDTDPRIAKHRPDDRT
jgi:hypothetical protein